DQRPIRPAPGDRRQRRTGRGGTDDVTGLAAIRGWSDAVAAGGHQAVDVVGDRLQRFDAWRGFAGHENTDMGAGGGILAGGQEGWNSSACLWHRLRRINSETACDQWMDG